MNNDKFNLKEKRYLMHKRKKQRRIITYLTFILLLSYVLIISINLFNKKNNTFVANIYKAKEITPKQFKVCIDAGHGDFDVGTVGITNYKEKDINLSISLKLGELLKENNIDVIYTRTSDKQKGVKTANDSLKERLKISKALKPDIFISIHCNSSNDENTNGVETWFKNNDINSENLAKSIQESLSKPNYTSDRYIKTYSKENSLAILEKNTSTSILIELGFLSNLKDEYYLSSETGQNVISNAILEGILNYKNAETIY